MADLDVKYKDRVKVILANSSRINEPDDPTFPWMVEAILRPPEFMSFAFVCIVGGSENVTMIAKDQEALDAAIESINLRKHPRLNRFRVSGPEGVTEERGSWTLDPPRRGPAVPA